ncbi:MAG: hypothetical protein DHS20C14_10260 [Phycisphaeraceae bacterium]|nr:MAG: hypothetical protein DHS20C14_10260 [Phycisphaeraceae bacterium]
MPIPTEITKGDIERAVEEYRAGERPEKLGPSVLYDVHHDGEWFPPKVIIALASKPYNGGEPYVGLFGGEGAGHANEVLRRLGFDVRPKPLILSQYRHSSDYKDVVGEQYHFPKRYRRSVGDHPREFVYYEPRDGGAQAYFGAGVITDVTEDDEDAGHYYGEIIDYRPFKHDVPYQDGPNGKPWEQADGMRPSVRTISRDLYEAILHVGGIGPPTSDAIPISATGSTHMDRLKKELQRAFLRAPTPKRRTQVQRILYRYERPSNVKDYVVATRSTRCQVCGEIGFKKRNGKRYCEVHHLFHLADDPPEDCLAPEYVVVVCATCHRRLHYANVSVPSRTPEGWEISIDGAPLHFPVDWAAFEAQKDATSEG